MARSRTKRWARTVLPTAITVTALGFGPAQTPVEAAPTAPAAVAQTAPSCGLPVVKERRPRTMWECTFVDNFTGSELDATKWRVQTSLNGGFNSTQDCYVDDPDNIKVSLGKLRLTVRKEAAPVLCQTPNSTYLANYTSASVNTYTKFSQAFGRFEFRAKFPAAKQPGLHGALWLFPDNWNKYGPWPLSGEIDVAEVYSQYNDRAIPFVHYIPLKASQTNNYCRVNVTNFHTYLLEWTTSTITISIDGKVCVQDTITPLAPLVAPQPFDQPFMLALMQGIGVQGNALDPAKPPAIPATLEVDWVKVWK